MVRNRKIVTRREKKIDDEEEEGNTNETGYCYLKRRKMSIFFLVRNYVGTYSKAKKNQFHSVFYFDYFVHFQKYEHAGRF